MYKCPKCGKLTKGAVSEDGIVWPLCRECTSSFDCGRGKICGNYGGTPSSIDEDEKNNKSIIFIKNEVLSKGDT